MRARSGAVLLVGWLSAISSARRVDVREIDLIPYNHETKDDLTKACNDLDDDDGRFCVRRGARNRSGLPPPKEGNLRASASA